MSESLEQTKTNILYEDDMVRQGLSFIKHNWHTIVLFAVLIVLASVYLPLTKSNYKSSPDFHAAVEVACAALGLIAGLALLVQFNILQSRFYLFLGLAFAVNGAEDLVNGLLSFEQIYRFTGLPASSLERFVPGTHVTGRLMMGFIALAAFHADKIFEKTKNPKRETLWTYLTVAAVTIFATAIAFKIPLPKFINPQFTISRPVDYFSAVLLAVVFLLIFQKYHQENDTLMWWIMLSIGIHMISQLMMSFSKSLCDAFFDVSHIYKLLGYAVPILGFLLYQIAIVSEHKNVGCEMQKAIEQLGKRINPKSGKKVLNEHLKDRSSGASEDKEQQITALKHQLEFVLGVTKTGLDIIDSDFNITYIDPEWQKIYGDPKGRKCYQYFMDRNEVCPGCGVVKALKTKQVVVTEQVLGKENNRPVQITSIPFQNKNNQWLVAEVNVDISERKKAEQKLHQYRDYLEQRLNEQAASITSANEKLEKEIIKQNQLCSELSKNDNLLNEILESSNDGIAVIDDNFRCTHWNRTMEKLFCIPKLKAMQKKENAWEIFPDSAARHLRETVERAMQGQIIHIEDMPYLLSNGKYLLVKETFIPLKSKKTHIRGAICIFRDITETKWDQDTLEDINRQMEKNIKKLTASNDRLKNLIQVAANDLIGRLRAIGNLADWISTDCYGKFDDKERKNLDLLTKRAQKIVSIINHLTQYARIKPVKNNEKFVGLNDVLSKVIEDIAPPDNIQITCDDNLPAIISEKVHIEQLFNTLLGSAVKRIGKSKGHIKIMCTQQDRFIKFTFADNGAPIAERNLEKVFDTPQTLSPRNEFEQAQVELSPLKIIIQMYDGKIWAEYGDENAICFVLPEQERKIEHEKLKTHITC
jgi:PAS domain S-box-containing protein